MILQLWESTCRNWCHIWPAISSWVSMATEVMWLCHWVWYLSIHLGWSLQRWHWPPSWCWESGRSLCNDDVMCDILTREVQPLFPGPHHTTPYSYINWVLSFVLKSDQHIACTKFFTTPGAFLVAWSRVQEYHEAVSTWVLSALPSKKKQGGQRLLPHPSKEM